MDKTRNCKLSRACASSRSVSRFKHTYFSSSLGKPDRRRKPVRAGTNHDGIGLGNFKACHCGCSDLVGFKKDTART